MYVACIKDNDCKCGSYCFGSYRIKWAFVCADGGFGRLEMALQKQEQILCKALHTDLGKSKTESVMCEIGLVQGEIRWMKQHLGRFADKNMSEHRWRSSLRKVIKALLLMAMC